jgi:hypothetical protein
VLQLPLAGDAMPMQDVVVKTLSGSRLVVISSSAYAQDEELTVHIAMPNGLASHRATVVSSEPSSVTGILYFRLELRLEDAESLTLAPGERTH